MKALFPGMRDRLVNTDLSADRRRKLAASWRRNGFDVAEAAAAGGLGDLDAIEDISPPMHRTVSPVAACPPGNGPGSCLCRRFKDFGFKESGGCGCTHLAVKMNERGAAWCQANLEGEILPAIKENLAERHLPYIPRLARQLVEAAIAESEGHAPTLGQRLAIGAAAVGSALLPDSIKNRPAKPAEVAVIVTCHNYGRFLAEALQSVLGQQVRPAEIVVVDDASTDDTPDVAARFAAAGVRYLRVDHRNCHASRRAGFHATTSRLICFLDADDILPPDYLSSALSILERPANWQVGIVYSDLERFGAEVGTWKYPPVANIDQVEKLNCMHSGSVVRRTALEITQAMEADRPLGTHEDWWTWRQVLRAGWKAVKSPAVYRYRRHEGGSKLEATKDGGYFHAAGLDTERVSIVTLIAGGPRAWAWDQTAAYLERQTWPHDQVSLVIGDTSQDEGFSRSVRQWAANCDYPDVRVIRVAVSRPGLADENRHDPAVGREVNLAMCRGWTRLTRGLDTPWTWTLEDDTLPPDDALLRMFSNVRPDTDAVCAPYKTRHHDGRHWLVFRQNPKGGQLLQDVPVGEEPGGVSEVAGSGFGCLLVRSQLLRRHAFAGHGKSPWYDPSFFQTQKPKTLCDWSVVCRHYTNAEEWV